MEEKEKQDSVHNEERLEWRLKASEEQPDVRNWQNHLRPWEVLTHAVTNRHVWVHGPVGTGVYYHQRSCSHPCSGLPPETCQRTVQNCPYSSPAAAFTGHALHKGSEVKLALASGVVGQLA